MAMPKQGKNSSASSDAQAENKNRRGIKPTETKDAGNGGFNTGEKTKGNPGNKKLPH